MRLAEEPPDGVIVGEVEDGDDRGGLVVGRRLDQRAPLVLEQLLELLLCVWMRGVCVCFGGVKGAYGRLIE